MLPFITVFGKQIPMYSLMIAIGILIGVFIAARFPSKKGVARQDVLFACIYAGIGAFIGAKLLFLAISLPQIIQSAPVFSLELLAQLFSFGFVFYGGAIGGLAGVYIYSRQYKLLFFELSESIIPSIPLMHAIGRVGCFCAGCCYGLPVSPPWGFYFSASPVAPHGVALFPVQLLESALNLVLFACIFPYSRKERHSGQILGFYLAGYAVERFFLEYFRYDAERGVLLGLSTSQWISLLLLPIGIYLLFRQQIVALLKKREA